jgi:hypothetical protein
MLTIIAIHVLIYSLWIVGVKVKIELFYAQDVCTGRTWPSLLHALDMMLWPVTTPYHLLRAPLDRLALPPGDAPP